MRAIYFPFTFVSLPPLDALNACFEPIYVLLPSNLDIPADMIQWEQDSRLVLDRRAAGDDAAMGEVLRQYHNWAQVHHGSEMAWMKSQKDSVPFYDDTSISHIRSELTGGDRGRPKPDPLQEARIFLLMAQVLDAETASLETDLERFDQMEKALFLDLKGESEAAPPVSGKTGVSEDRGAFMTTDRLKAWARLYLAEPPALSKSPALLVTTSRAVLEEVMEGIPDAESIASFKRIFVIPSPDDSAVQWRQALLDYLSHLDHPDASPGTDWPVPPSGGERAVSLSVFRISGMSVDMMIEHLASPESTTLQRSPKEPALLALIEMHPS